MGVLPGPFHRRTLTGEKSHEAKIKLLARRSAKLRPADPEREMTVSECLDEMRSGVAGCSLVSFGDLKTGMVLRTSATGRHKQEYLEEIIQQAVLNFEMSDALFVDNGQAEEKGHSVIVATPDDVRIFVRSKKNRSDVVCCVCDRTEAVARVEAYTQKVFLKLSEKA